MSTKKQKNGKSRDINELFRSIVEGDENNASRHLRKVLRKKVIERFENETQDLK